MQNQKSIFQFCENVSGYSIPVLNEREVRAAAGIYLVLMMTAIQRVVYTWDFALLRYSITIFLGDFLIRVFISPKYSPSLILGRLLVRNQKPEYVGAPQKKFAWIIGLVLSTTIFLMLNVFNLHSPIVGLSCFICQIFLMFESCFGICVGCKIYKLVAREKAQFCPGEVCDPKDTQAVQYTSWAQIAVVVAFFSVFALAVPFISSHYSQEPSLIHGMEKPPLFNSQAK